MRGDCMSEKSTQDLNDILKHENELDLDLYASLLQGQPYHDFVSYMDHLISKKGVKRKDIIIQADLPLGYGYKLLTQEARTSDRDKLLRLFIAMQMNSDECRRALSYYGLAPLYPRVKRDVVIISALNQGIFSVDRVNDLLISANQEPLAASGTD